MLLHMNIHHFLFAFDGKHICWFLSRSSSVLPYEPLHRPLNGLSAVPGKRDALWYQTNKLFAYFVREMQSQQTCLSKTIGGSSFQQERAKVGSILFALWSWQRAVYVWNHLDNMIRVIKSKSFESAESDVRVSRAEFRRSSLSASLSCCLYVCNCLLMCVLFSLTSSCLSSSGAPIRKLPWQLAALQLSCCDGCTGGRKWPEGQNWWEGWEIEVTVPL